MQLLKVFVQHVARMAHYMAVQWWRRRRMGRRARSRAMADTIRRYENFTESHYHA